MMSHRRRFRSPAGKRGWRHRKIFLFNKGLKEMAGPEATETLMPTSGSLPPTDDEREIIYSRQKDLVPQGKIKPALVVGVGAIGRQVSHILGAIGVPDITLIDFDIVNVENFAAQGYGPEQRGMFKVQATGQELLKQSPGCNVSVVKGRFRHGIHGMGAHRVIFSCVDSMSIRKLIWRSVKNDFDFLADGRMLGEALRYFAVDSKDQDNVNYYGDPKNLYTDSEALEGSCTSKTTLYSAYVIAGKMVQQYTRWLRGLPIDYDVTENLLTTEIFVSGKDYDRKE